MKIQIEHDGATYRVVPELLAGAALDWGTETIVAREWGGMYRLCSPGVTESWPLVNGQRVEWLDFLNRYCRPLSDPSERLNA